MKKLLLTLLTVASSLSVQAYDYPYLVLETSDGTTTAFSVESLCLTISDGTLKVTNSSGTKSFDPSTLSKMYFSTDGTTDGIQNLDEAVQSGDAQVYDLQGRKVSLDQMMRGIYVIKTQNSTRKVTVK